MAFALAMAISSMAEICTDFSCPPPAVPEFTVLPPVPSASAKPIPPAPPWLAWTWLEAIETVPAMESGKSAFLVTGDPARNKVLCVPGGGFATVRVVLPRDWDKLMEERGYASLESFRLSTVIPDGKSAHQ